MLKKLLPLLFFTILFFPTIATHAQADQRCWRESDCKGDPYNGTFYDKPDATAVCGETDAVGTKLGFCLPTKPAETAVSFGGQTTFTNIGTFINFIYRYGVTVAGILAVIMIIIAGVQWTLSGGSPDAIGAAKKRIAGAVVGVLLAALSYVILSTVNPYLVNLRLPQVWMINKQGIAPPSCEQVTGAGLSYAGPAGGKIDKNAAENAKYTSKDQLPAVCGSEYFVEKTGGQTCLGNVCIQKHLCYAGVNEKAPGCKAATIGGVIKNSDFVAGLTAQADSWITGTAIGFFTEMWAWPWLNEPEINVVCNNGDYDVVGSQGLPEGGLSSPSTFFNVQKLTQEYRITLSDDEIKNAWKEECDSPDDVKGFALYLDMNEQSNGVDERHFVGINRQTGKAFDIIDWSCHQANLVLKAAPKEVFFTEEELLKGVQFSFDANDIHDIDGGSDRAKWYGHTGYTGDWNCYFGL